MEGIHRETYGGERYRASMPSLDMPSSQNIYIQPGRLLWMYSCASTIELFYMFVKRKSVGHTYVGLFLDPLFCSIDMCLSLCPNQF